MGDNFKKSIYWVLSQLQEELFAGFKEGQETTFEFEESVGKPSKETQARVIKFLSEAEAIMATPFYSKGLFANQSPLIAMAGGKPIGYQVKILQPRFDELCEEYSTYKSNDEVFQFNLTMYYNRADFYMDDKRKIKLRSLIKPYILEALYKAKGEDVSSEKIKSILETKIGTKATSRKVSTLLDELRDSIEENFKIDPKIILPDGVSGSGYKIGDIVINITKG